MKYANWKPTQFDTAGLGLNDRQDWIVGPVAVNRDSNALVRSNFRVILADVGGESETVEVHRFGHWACGWFEIMLFHPSREQDVSEWVDRLDNYPVADEDDFSEEEHGEAEMVWRNCYNPKERIDYIRRNRNQFEFRDMADVMGCVRGKYFAGYDSELIN